MLCFTTGCYSNGNSQNFASSTSPPKSEPLNLTAIRNLIAQDIPTTDQIAELTKTWDAVSCFSLALFREVLSYGDENAVISPLSAYYVLAMVALGAREDTLYQFQSVLGSNPQELAPELTLLAQYLMYTEGNTLLNLAGSIWIDDIYTINPDFNQAMIRYFHSPAVSRNLSEQATVNEINEWICPNRWDY